MICLRRASVAQASVLTGASGTMALFFLANNELRGNFGIVGALLGCTFKVDMDLFFSQICCIFFTLVSSELEIKTIIDFYKRVKQIGKPTLLHCCK